MPRQGSRMLSVRVPTSSADEGPALDKLTLTADDLSAKFASGEWRLAEGSIPLSDSSIYACLVVILPEKKRSSISCAASTAPPKSRTRRVPNEDKWR